MTIDPKGGMGGSGHVDFRIGDVRQVMATIADSSVSLVASSPP